MSETEALSTAQVASASDKLIITSEHKELAKKTIAKDLSDAKFALFLYECNRQGIHELDRLLIPNKRNDSESGEKRMTFVTTVDLLRSRAADTGEYAGNDDAIFEYLDGGSQAQMATVTVWATVYGQKCPVVATARWKGCYTGEQQGCRWR